MARIFFSVTAEHDYKKLPRDAQERVNAILGGDFVADPFASEFHTQKLKPPLHGYRVRVGDYRILFEYNTDTILVYKIRHRKDAYR